MHERLTKIDDLTATIDQLRAANKQLDQEADRWAKLYATNGAGHSMTSTMR